MALSKRQLIFRIISTAVTIAIIGFIFFQSMKPADISSNESGRVVALLNSITEFLGLGQPFEQGFVRTCAHFTEFAVLGVSLLIMFNTYLKKPNKCFLFSVVSSALIALCDETLQIFSDGRTFQLKDILIDSLGALCGSLIMLFVLWSIVRNKAKKSKNDFTKE